MVHAYYTLGEAGGNNIRGDKARNVLTGAMTELRSVSSDLPKQIPNGEHSSNV